MIVSFMIAWLLLATRKNAEEVTHEADGTTDTR